MSKEQIKKEAESLIEKYKGCSIILMQNSKGSVQYPFTSGYVGNYYTEIVFKECAIKEVQSKIDLLEKIQNSVSFITWNKELNQQKEILKYLEEL